jgi:hypothetical protein
MPLVTIPFATLILVCLGLPACAVVEPEKQPIYTNTSGGLMCGTEAANQCKVPAGKRLVIEHVSGFVFQPLGTRETISVAMAIKAPTLGLNGNSFHVFVAQKTLTTIQRDVFVFSSPFKMMLPPSAEFYFSGVAGVAVSGYLVNSN